MKYTQVEGSYKFDILAKAIYEREIEYFHYDFDKKNFEYLLLNLPDNDYLKEVNNRLIETIKQMKNVESIIEALKSQIDNQVAYDEAVVKAIKNRKEKK
jgi:hypothetical protein